MNCIQRDLTHRNISLTPLRISFNLIIFVPVSTEFLVLNGVTYDNFLFTFDDGGVRSMNSIFKTYSSKKTMYQKSLKKLKRVKEIRKNNKTIDPRKIHLNQIKNSGKIVFNAKIEGDEDLFGKWKD